MTPKPPTPRRCRIQWPPWRYTVTTTRPAIGYAIVSYRHRATRASAARHAWRQRRTGATTMWSTWRSAATEQSGPAIRSGCGRPIRASASCAETDR